jgi:hypothetical protein
MDGRTGRNRNCYRYFQGSGDTGDPGCGDAQGIHCDDTCSPGAVGTSRAEGRENEIRKNERYAKNDRQTGDKLQNNRHDCNLSLNAPQNAGKTEIPFNIGLFSKSEIIKQIK